MKDRSDDPLHHERMLYHCADMNAFLCGTTYFPYLALKYFQPHWRWFIDL